MKSLLGQGQTEVSSRDWKLVAGPLAHLAPTHDSTKCDSDFKVISVLSKICSEINVSFFSALSERLDRKVL